MKTLPIASDAIRTKRDTRVKASVSVAQKSGNSKIGVISATYVAQVTCPNSCPFLSTKVCYAMNGPVGWGTAQRNAYGYDLMDVIRLEATMIDKLPAKNARNLRVHVVGDSPTDEAAQVTSSAMNRYEERTGKRAWTYTHAWRDVNHASWNGANVLASTESTTEAIEAMDKGYAAAIVVDHHESAKAYRDAEYGIKVIPCPNQTSQEKITCNDCMLCTKPAMLLAQRAVIAFAVHGPKNTMKKTKAALASITNGGN